jgi:hypothetical protein
MDRLAAMGTVLLEEVAPPAAQVFHLLVTPFQTDSVATVAENYY